jgi:acid phosphatase
MTKYAHATAFSDPLPDSIPSEPHYVWIEAGTNTFSDVTFTGDGDPSSGNSTKSTAHLVTQMQAASPPVTWMGVMEGLNSGTGVCPIHSSGFYGAKHDPFVFFQDIAGSPPSASNALCAAHHQAFTSGQALVQGTVAQYTFVSPNVCNDMHGDPSCPASASNVIAAGDQWLATNLPPLIDYVNAHAGVIFVVWDEPEGGSALTAFFAIGPHVKPGYAGSVAYTHSSLTKSVGEIFNLPPLATVAGASDLKDLFQPGFFP